MKFNGKHSNAFNFIANKYLFRFNVVTNFYEFQKKKTKKKHIWRKYDDRQKNQILLDLMKDTIDVPSEKVNIFIESQEFSPDFNPFNEYFEELPAWNEKKDHIKKFAETISVEKPEHFQKVLERFLVGTIDCLLNPDSVNDVCLVFQSPQGIGKTRWMRSLLPKQFQSEYLYEGAIDTKNKDHTMYLSQYWFIHLDELESLRSNDISSIKSYITRQRISVRKAYGRYKTNFVRRASFLGSVNEDKFLTDLTGNRRWLVFKVNDINYQHGLDPDKIWSQAYALYKSGYRHWFDIEEIKEINKHNEKFREISLEEELLLKYFNFNTKKGKGQLLPVSEIMIKILYNKSQFTSKLMPGKMGKALSKHTIYKKMKRGYQHYYVEFLGADPKNPFGVELSNINETDDDLPF